MDMHFWAPTVAPSGDACPMRAWQDLRTLDEADHSKKLEQNFENKETTLLYKDDPGPPNFCKVLTSVKDLVLIYIILR